MRAIVLCLMLLAAGCAKSPDSSQAPTEAVAIQTAQRLIVEGMHEPTAVCVQSSAFHFDAPREHNWRVNGQVDLPGNLERPFAAELFWDNGRFQKVWIAVGKQEIDKHER